MWTLELKKKITNKWGLFVYDNRKWEMTLIYAELASLQDIEVWYSCKIIFYVKNRMG